MYCTLWRVALTALIAAATSVSAQSVSGCPLIVIDGAIQPPAATGPGVAFGVNAYQCASCGFKRENGGRAGYSFNAEPIVLETTAWSPLRTGDVIEAVNGQPITTRAGADQFTYPPAGESVITVRRDGSRMQVKAQAHPECGREGLFGASNIERVQIIRGPMAVFRYGPDALGGAFVIKTKEGSGNLDLRPTPHPDPVRTLTPGAVPSADSAHGHGSAIDSRYGFAIACLPSCTRARTSDGTEYWKFDGYPPIYGIRPGGPAALAGIRVGDVVIEVDGVSILTEDGAQRFLRSGRTESMHLTILRDGRRVGYLLRAR
ncbi:MAG: PDZ domain-containing protein [Gemmatimonadaceae bacterium]